MINRVVIVGRLTRDPELRKTGTGNSVASFTVACDNRMKAPDGSKTTSFIPCVAWMNQADIVTKIARKGMLVGVEGRLNQRTYDRKDGTKAQVLEVICDSVQFLEPKGEQAEGEALDLNQEAPEESKNLDTIDLPDDDLPF